MYLGHVVSKDGIRLNLKKVEAILQIPLPMSLKALHHFLGMTSYYCQFIEGFSKIADPLIRLQSKSSVYQWDDWCQAAFKELKQRLVSAPILAYPDFTKDFRLQTDGSKEGVGAVLSQLDQNGQEHVVAYASKVLEKHQRNYSTTDLEALAVVWAIKYFQHYLYGRRFEVVTDHEALTSLMKMDAPNCSRQTRWMIKLSEYDFKIIHRPGRLQPNVDCLSRDFPPPTASVVFTVDCPKPSLPRVELWTLLVKQQQKEASAARRQKKWKQKSPPPYWAPKTRVDFANTATSADFEVTPQAVLLTAEDMKDVGLAQRGNPKLKPFIDYLEAQVLPEEDAVAKQVLREVDKFEFVDGQLMQTVPSELRKHRKENNCWHLVVPTSLQSKVLQDNHNHITSGHLGVKRTYGRLVEKFFWHGMYCSISEWIAMCPHCACRKGSPKDNAYNTVSIAVSCPLQVMGTDHMGPFPKSERGNRFILTFTDHFSKFVVAAALPDVSAETIARVFMEDVVCKFGALEQLLSDQGKNFIGKVMSKVNELLQVRKI